MSDYTPFKACSKCEIEKPDTTDYYSRSKRHKNGMYPVCKECVAKYKAQYAQKNKEKLALKQSEYYQANADEVKAKAKKHREDNLQEYRAKKRVYERRNKDRAAKRHAAWVKKNPEKVQANRQRYRARKKALPSTLTSTQWITCLEYFNYCCAVCGNQLRDLFGDVEPHADHWIPITSPECPGTVVENMICLCSVCNMSKHNTTPEQWVTDRFGRYKATKILERVNAYFQWALDNGQKST